MGAYLFKKFPFQGVAIRSAIWIITINGETSPPHKQKPEEEKEDEQQYPRY
ncbi:hypothetical protein A512_89 [Escherichia phage A51.2]|uniref:Uncharacterized protein n=1 Tax=Escherichia phage A51.2 TaxID=2950726 RepID=A0A9E7SGP7_9CAUD|nr:hypothetical protein A512_89 [Escherichia phage A51.2]